MNANFTFVDLLSIFALFLCLFYAFQNWTLKQNKTVANRYFTYYLLNLSFIILFFFLLRIQLDDFAKFLIPILISSCLLMPPLLWVYQNKLISDSPAKNDRKHYLVPLLFGLSLVILFVLYFAVKDLPTKKVIATLLKYVALSGLTAVFILSNIYYIFLSIRALIRHRKSVNQFYSYTEKIDLNWFKILIGGYIFLVAGLIVCQFLKGDLSDIVFYGVLIIYIVYTGHQAMRQKVIKIGGKIELEESQEDESTRNEIEEQFTEAQHQLFSDLKEKLEKYVPEKKPYLDQELTIFKLSKDLNTNTKYLSYVINKEFNQNFINYINEYRIREVKQKLTDENSKNLTIEALAQNAGFKSKSSFNMAFKKVTGTTPSAFIKSISNN